ncbi:hypothetical protein LIX17_16200 [Mycobacterium avium subsp. hominissuis]|uniref:hypothetical protein n=1 Tax=Mycobacterium avium TaxID=1764 RepID=UPI0003922B9E|nr:hypothetical protein [Mycobacterium avium]ETA99898.1 hypothetical protein O982_05275 [Mycobacterium avium 10-5581]APA76854.1 hypothetical protein KV38_16190 [Mycobacterium avium subsp. hominissuis]ATO63664.1 hypothetical protein BEP52_16260 [Mycobacterium avium subsp. hominissuis]ATO68209.1 hypothetical protein BJP78_16015 [Mycobacterium avium subsp. hominissuis]ATO72755.1 hypothetical protein BJP74_15945 [Mycobacterium avium subsp. hominissuis]
MRAVVGVTRVLGGLALAAIAAVAPRAVAQPPGFPNLDGFTAVPSDGYLTSGAPGSPPRIGFSTPYAVACDFYGGPAPVPQPSQDIKCKGDMSGMDDVPFPGGRPRPGDCVLGTVDFKGPGYQLSRMSYGGCDGNPAPLPSGGKTLGAGQKLTYLNVTCAVGADHLIACLDTTSGDHGFVLQRSGSWAF